MQYYFLIAVAVNNLISRFIVPFHKCGLNY
jgi:hypothetical protein